MFSSRRLVTLLAFVAVGAALPATSAFAQAAAAPASAAQESSTTLRLSLSDAPARAQERAPEVTIGQYQVREAQAYRVGAGLVMPVNPRIAFDVRPTLRGAPSSEVGYAASADFLFEVGGAPAARRNEARRHVDVANAELRVSRLEARATVWAAYVRTLVADQRIKETTFAIEVAERVLNASKQRAQAGAAGDIEQSLAESELGQLKAQLTGAVRQRDQSIMGVRDALDVPAEVPVLLTSPLDSLSAVAPPDVLAKRALAGRADLEAIRKRIDLIVATQERLQRELFPRVGGYLGVDAAPVSPVFGIVGLTVELPLVQRNQGPRARAEAQREGQLARLELEARRVVRDVYATRAAYESRIEELRMLTETALPTAERTLDLVETGWRSGRFDIFRVTSASRDLVRVRGLRLDALEAAWMERIVLDRVVGGLAI